MYGLGDWLPCQPSGRWSGCATSNLGDVDNHVWGRSRVAVSIATCPASSLTMRRVAVPTISAVITLTALWLFNEYAHWMVHFVGLPAAYTTLASGLHEAFIIIAIVITAIRTIIYWSIFWVDDCARAHYLQCIQCKTLPTLKPILRDAAYFAPIVATAWFLDLIFPHFDLSVTSDIAHFSFSAFLEAIYLLILLGGWGCLALRTLYFTARGPFRLCFVLSKPTHPQPGTATNAP